MKTLNLEGLTRAQQLDALRQLLGGTFHVVHRDAEGRVLSEEDFHNIVTDEGLDHFLDVVLAAGTQISTWYLALKDSTGDPVVGTRTYASPGFTEITSYDEAARPAWTAGAVASQSVDNAGSPASYTMNATVTVYGVALVSDSTKGDTAAAGAVMLSLANFASSKGMSSGESLDITYTFTSADDGA